MLLIICSNDLLFNDFSYTNYSNFSDGRVVGTIDLLKSDKVPPFTCIHKENNMKSASD